MSHHWLWVVMFDPDLIRFICGKLAAEDNPERLRKLAETLRFVIRLDTEKKSDAESDSLQSISQRRAA